MKVLYGTVGGVIVVLLWFYISGIAILAGAELNAEIEHASPYGKAPRARSAQGKLLLGRRAARVENVNTTATRPERITTSPDANRTLPSMEHTATRHVRSRPRRRKHSSWQSAGRDSRGSPPGLLRRAAVGAVVIGVRIGTQHASVSRLSDIRQEERGVATGSRRYT